MNPIFVEQMAKYRQDELARDAAANRAAARAKGAPAPSMTVPQPLYRLAGRLRLVRHGSAA